MKILILMFLFLNQAFALEPDYKETGGGCAVSEVICDEQEVAAATEVSAEELQKLIHNISEAVLQNGFIIEDELKVLLSRRRWLATTAKFNPEACAITSGVLDPADTTVHACQDRTRVFISQNFWQTNSDQLKAQLILHEILISRAIDQKVPLSSARETLALLLQPASFENIFLARDRMTLQFAFPYFATTYEHEFVVSKLKDFADATCSIANQVVSEESINAFYEQALMEMTERFFTTQSSGYVLREGILQILDIKQKQIYCSGDGRLAIDALVTAQWGSNL